MRILVLPRDPNPYQRLLYSEMQRRGVEVTYLGELTPSHTLNLLLLPLEVAARRIGGARLIHLHWVFAFAFPGSRRSQVMRGGASVWFLVWLRISRMLGVHLVWTVHNVLPHEPVFADDVSARRALVEASDLVIAHSRSALVELAALGAVPRRSAVIQHGPIAPLRSATWPGTPRANGEPRRFLFFGRVQEYKGVDDLLVAFSAMPEGAAVHLTVAGQCDDPRLRSRLNRLAQRCRARVVLRLEHVPEEEVASLFSAVHAVILPFRKVTTSGSAMLALSHGRPLIVPDLPGLVDLPDRAVLRYERTIPALTAAIARLARADDNALAVMSAAAVDYASRTTWQEIAESTIAEMLSVLGGVPDVDLRRRPFIAP
jgi:glycosyltransferase involved in cell wall biosynthesis